MPEILPTGPLVVARRWDQLGGRLFAMANAAALADRSGLPFRFVWPRGLDPAINQPEELFSPEFLAEFEISELALEGRARVTPGAVERPGANSFVDVEENAAVVAFGEPVVDAQARFRRAFEGFGWAPVARRLIDECSYRAGDIGLSAVHVRAGDIVDGDWRHLVAHEKYAPTPYVEYAIEQLGDDGRRVVVLSDNTGYLSWLGERFPAVVTAPELVPEYAALTEVQRALADILVLSRCEVIVGSRNSAFSRLGLGLGLGRLVRADQIPEAGMELEVLRAGIAARRPLAASQAFMRPLLARDACWCADVFADAMPLSEQRELAGLAVELDPGFSGAQARVARLAALAGDEASALSAVAEAVRIAQPVTRHVDPFTEALATEVAVRCFVAALPPPGVRFGFRRRSAEIARERLETARELVRAPYDRCFGLDPYQMDKGAIETELARVVAALDGLLRVGTRERRRAMRRLAAACAVDSALPISGAFTRLERHRAEPLFDPVPLDLAVLADRLDAALG